MHHEHRHRKRRRFGLAGLLGVLVASTLLFAAPVAAHPRHKAHERHPRHKVHKYDKHYKHYKHQRSAPVYRRHGPRHFVVPTAIRHVQLDRYQPFYQGRVYHRPHRHYHSVYDFPVYRDHRYAYRPHVYCGGELYYDGYVSYRGPRVSLRVRF